jgi:hypothetical protein
VLGTWTIIAHIYTKDNERITCVTAEVDYSKQAVRELEHERFWNGSREEGKKTGMSFFTLDHVLSWN